MQSPPPSDDAIKLLRVLRERAMDGYTLVSKVSLPKAQVLAGLRELMDFELIRARGDVDLSSFGESYLSVPPDFQNRVDRLLESLRPYPKSSA